MLDRLIMWTVVVALCVTVGGAFGAVIVAARMAGGPATPQGPLALLVLAGIVVVGLGTALGGALLNRKGKG